MPDGGRIAGESDTKGPSGQDPKVIMPDGGRIVIIDDKKDEGLPLLRALVKKGHPAIFLTPEQERLPEAPLDSIRIVFLDLILDEGMPSEETMMSTIQSVMRRIVDPDKNGPFVLILWTGNGNHADAVKKRLRKCGFRFVAAMMEKHRYMNGGGFDLEKIQAGIRSHVKEAQALQLFMLWENSVRRASGNI